MTSERLVEVRVSWLGHPCYLKKKVWCLLYFVDSIIFARNCFHIEKLILFQLSKSSVITFIYDVLI